MNIWLDAQLPHALALWINQNFSVEAVPLREIGLRHAKDQAIFFAARQQATIIMTKDSDFIRLLDEYGPPPQIIWLTCGNASNATLRELLTTTLGKALDLLQAGEKMVEIGPASDPWPSL